MKPHSFETRAREALEQSLETLPDATLQQLAQRRQAALSMSQSQTTTQFRTQTKAQTLSSHIRAWIASWHISVSRPQVAMAGGVCMAVLIALTLQPPRQTEPNMDNTLAMMDSLTTEEDVEVLTDPDFYWFASTLDDENTPS